MPKSVIIDIYGQIIYIPLILNEKLLFMTFTDTLQFMMKYALLLALSMLLATSAVAANTPPKAYQINLIIFKYANNSNLNSEIWPNNPPQPAFKRAQDLLPIANQASNPNTNGYYTALATNQFGMSNSLKRLQKQSDYQIISTIAWQQPLNSRGKLIHIFAGQAYDDQGNIIDTPGVTPPQNPVINTNQQDDNTTPALPSAAMPDNAAPVQNLADGADNPQVAQQQTAISTQMPSAWEINGTVKVTKTRFINFAANFLLTEKVPVVDTDSNNSNTQNQLMGFSLKQTIRMRNKEIHYLDNPLYGILVYITPVK